MSGMYPNDIDLKTSTKKWYEHLVYPTDIELKTSTKNCYEHLVQEKIAIRQINFMLDNGDIAGTLGNPVVIAWIIEVDHAQHWGMNVSKSGIPSFCFIYQFTFSYNNGAKLS